MIINPITFGGDNAGDIIKPYAERSGTISLKDNEVSYIASFAFSGAYGWGSLLTEVSFPNCTTIGASAFFECSMLSKAYFPNCTTLGGLYGNSAIFNSCFRLESLTLGVSNLSAHWFQNYIGSLYSSPMLASGTLFLSLANCTTIPLFAFNNARTLKEVYMPNCTEMWSGAFAYCENLSKANYPLCFTLSNNAFYGCKMLSDVYLPLCTKIPDNCFAGCGLNSEHSFITGAITSIGTSAFNGCMNLNSINLLQCSFIGAYAFHNCNLLSVDAPLINTILESTFDGNMISTLNIPSCNIIGSYAFARNYVLESVNAPLVTTIESFAFQSCRAYLQTLSFPHLLSIRSGAFNDCWNLVSLYLLGGTVCKLQNGSCFLSTPIGGYSASAGQYGSVYVPASLLASYKAASYWKTISARIVGI